MASSDYQNIRFPDPLLMRALGGEPNPNGGVYDDDAYQLLGEFRCLWDGPDGGFGGMVTAPALFIMDRASIPRLFHSVITKDGPHQKPSIIHDWLFYNRGEMGPGLQLTFDQVNDLFLAAMVAHRVLDCDYQISVAFMQRNVIYGCVNSDMGRAVWEDDE